MDEYRSWLAYRKKRGPLNPMYRQDDGFAMLAVLIERAVGNKDAKHSDYIFYGKNEDKDQEEIMTDPRDFIKMFSGVK